MKKYLILILIVMIIISTSCVKKNDGGISESIPLEGNSSTASDPLVVPETEGVWVSKDGPLMGVLVAGCIGYGKV